MKVMKLQRIELKFVDRSIRDIESDLRQNKQIFDAIPESVTGVAFGDFVKFGGAFL